MGRPKIHPRNNFWDAARFENEGSHWPAYFNDLAWIRRHVRLHAAIVISATSQQGLTLSDEF